MTPLFTDIFNWLQWSKFPTHRWRNCAKFTLTSEMLSMWETFVKVLLQNRFLTIDVAICSNKYEKNGFEFEYNLLGSRSLCTIKIGPQGEKSSNYWVNKNVICFLCPTPRIRHLIFKQLIYNLQSFPCFSAVSLPSTTTTLSQYSNVSLNKINKKTAVFITLPFQ